jgi:hypothetical protein
MVKNWARLRVNPALFARRAPLIWTVPSGAELLTKLIGAIALVPLASTAFAHPSRGERADEQQKPDQSGEER